MSIRYTDTQGTAAPGAVAEDTRISPFFAAGGQTARQVDEVLTGYTAWIALPPAPAVAVSRLPALLGEVRTLTGWSQRDLADVLDTSHTTVRRLETDGRVTARSRSTAARIAPMHGVLVRLARLAPDPAALGVALATRVGEATSRPIDLLRNQQWGAAFTAGLDALQGPRVGMLTPPSGAETPRAATRAILPR